MSETGKYAKGLAVRDGFSEAAVGLFAERGFNASSIADITSAAELTKNQFFHHFGNKQSLGLAVIEKAQRAWETDVIAPAVMYPDSTHQLVAYHQKLAVLLNEGWPYLKLAAMLSNEYHSYSPEMQAGVSELNGAILDGLRTTIKGFKKEGVLLPVMAKARLMAATVLTLWYGIAATGGSGSELVDDNSLLEVTCQLFGLSFSPGQA